MKVLIVDDHAVVRSGLVRLLSVLPQVEITEAADGRAALACVRAEQPDLVLLDLNLPGIGGLELLRRVLVEHPLGRVMVLSMHAEALYASRAMQAGAMGYLSKGASPEELLEAVRRIIAGGRYIEAEIAQELALQAATTGNPVEQLSARDLEILRLLGSSQGLSEIAEALGVSYKTVANTCSQIKAKLGVSKTADLVYQHRRAACEASGSEDKNRPIIRARTPRKGRALETMRAVVGLGKALGMAVLAEGVETAQ